MCAINNDDVLHIVTSRKMSPMSFAAEVYHVVPQACLWWHPYANTTTDGAVCIRGHTWPATLCVDANAGASSHTSGLQRA